MEDGGGGSEVETKLDDEEAKEGMEMMMDGGSQGGLCLCCRGPSFYVLA